MNMKRILSILLVVLLTACLICQPVIAADYSHLKKYADVDTGSWYVQYIDRVVKDGIMNGVSDKKFGIDSNITLVQTITIAARLHKLYYSGTDDFKPGVNWYTNYVAYALKNGIIGREYSADELNAPITRGQFAVILSASYPDNALTPINTVSYIPDVKEGDSCFGAVMRLYKAGVCTGGTDGSYSPGKNIKRVEAAAVISRMTAPELRQKVTLKGNSTVAFFESSASVKKGGTVTLHAYKAEGGSDLTFTMEGTAGSIRSHTGNSVTIEGKSVGSCTVTAMDTDGNTATCKIWCHSSGAQGTSLTQLAAEGKVRLSVAISSIQKAVMTVENLTNERLNYCVTPGSYFEPSNRDYQRMLILSLPWGSLNAGGSAVLSFDIVCMDFKCQLPESRIQYFLCSGEDSGAAVLADYFATGNKNTFPIRQAAVWIAQDDVSYAECGTLISTITDSTGKTQTSRTITREDYDAATKLVENTLK